MKIANALSIVLGVVLFLIASQWIFTPATAAETLSMPFLEGDARNLEDPSKTLKLKNIL